MESYNCAVCGEATEHWVKLDENENIVETECTICHEIIHHESD